MSLTAPATPLAAGFHALVVAGLLLLFGYLLADVIGGRWQIDVSSRLGLAVPALVAFVFVLMLLHMATHGSFLSSPWLVRGTTVAVAIALVALKVLSRKKRRGVSESGRNALVALAMLALALLVWGSPVFRTIPLDLGADTKLHMGWASQIMNGEPAPSGTITGDIPNYYPWMFHAVVAFVANFTPGARAYHAQGAIHLLLVSGMALGLFALGLRLTERWTGGAAAALFGAVTGGFGFVLTQRPDVVFWPTGEMEHRYMGDLLAVRSYNVSFNNIVPAFPRDLAFVLLVGFLLLLALGLARRSAASMAGAGVVLGLTGLTGGEAFIVGVVTSGVVSVFAAEPGRLRTAVALLVPALAVWSFWIAPLVMNYLLYGFVNMAAQPRTFAAVEILFSWGITTPFAVYGIVRWLRVRSMSPAAKVAVAFLASAGGMIVGSSIFPALLGKGFTTLGRTHRYWPLLYVGVAMVAAVGARDILDRVLHRQKALFVVLGSVVVITAIASPALASLAFPERRGTIRLIGDALRGERHTLLNVVSPSAGRLCTAAVPLDLSHPVFGYTGYRLVLFRWSDRVGRNAPRMRWRRIYDDIGSVRERLRDNRILTLGLGSNDRWEATARKYGVDVVVVPADAERGSFERFPSVTVTSKGRPYRVVKVTRCAA